MNKRNSNRVMTFESLEDRRLLAADFGVQMGPAMFGGESDFAPSAYVRQDVGGELAGNGQPGDRLFDNSGPSGMGMQGGGVFFSGLTVCGEVNDPFLAIGRPQSTTASIRSTLSSAAMDQIGQSSQDGFSIELDLTDGQADVNGMIGPEQTVTYRFRPSADGQVRLQVEGGESADSLSIRLLTSSFQQVSSGFSRLQSGDTPYLNGGEWYYLEIESSSVDRISYDVRLEEISYPNVDGVDPDQAMASFSESLAGLHGNPWTRLELENGVAQLRDTAEPGETYRYWFRPSVNGQVQVDVTEVDGSGDVSFRLLRNENQLVPTGFDEQSSGFTPWLSAGEVYYLEVITAGETPVDFEIRLTELTYPEVDGVDPTSALEGLATGYWTPLEFENGVAEVTGEVGDGGVQRYSFRPMVHGKVQVDVEGLGAEDDVSFRLYRSDGELVPTGFGDQVSGFSPWLTATETYYLEVIPAGTQPAQFSVRLSYATVDVPDLEPSAPNFGPATESADHFIAMGNWNFGNNLGQRQIFLPDFSSPTIDRPAQGMSSPLSGLGELNRNFSEASFDRESEEQGRNDRGQEDRSEGTRQTPVFSERLAPSFSPWSNSFSGRESETTRRFDSSSNRFDTADATSTRDHRDERRAVDTFFSNFHSLNLRF